MRQIPSKHTDFVIKREFGVTPEAVFKAWADPTAKQAWADCHTENTVKYSLDFRLHGHETHHVVFPNGSIQQVEKVFFDIVPARRIVFAYEIRLDARLLSVSLVTVEFSAGGRGTRMVYTEQLAYLDGHEDRAQRLQGTEEGLDRLGQALLRN
jgi:uncharacterized protein YndB with AHSA1/START domain